MTTCGCKTPLRMRVADRSYYFADKKIGKKMSLTPEGFLLCEGVPVARTGEQVYGPGETPLKPGKDGLVHIQRDEKEVFRPETIASFEGKDVVDEHPEEGVDPSNWREVSVGHAQNIRRGEGPESEYLLADLIIKDPDAIAAVREGKREISCGYDCDYEQTGDGQGRQYNIVGNHVALVEHGRCGPRCAIKDHSPQEISNMPKKTTVKDRLKKLFGAKDDAEFEQMLNRPDGDEAVSEGGESGGGVEIHNHIHMPGEGAAPGTSGEDEPDPAALAAASEEQGDDPQELPGWFLEHVAQSNARFDRLEQMLSALTQEESEEQEGEEGGDSAENPAADPDIMDEIGEGAGESAEAAEGDGYDAEGEEGKEEREAEEATGDSESEEEEEGKKKTGDKAHVRGKGKKPALKGKKHKAMDSAPLADSYQATCALAEMLVPGIALPTFDSKAPAKKTFDSICGLRRRVLDKLNQDADGRSLIEDIHGRPLRLKQMSCGAVRVLFRSVGAAAKRTTDSRPVAVAASAGGGLGVSDARKIKSPADLNRLHSERYGAAH